MVEELKQIRAQLDALIAKQENSLTMKRFQLSDDELCILLGHTLVSHTKFAKVVNGEDFLIEN